jgi:hypothetical protein
LDTAVGKRAESFSDRSADCERMENTRRTIRPWSRMPATRMATSMFSKASRLFSTVDTTDRSARFTTPWSGVHGLEGLVRDNRVEVRVLFGA